MKRKSLLLVALALGLAITGNTYGALVDPAVIPVLKRSFFHGREYFVLRSGRAKMIVQADQADLAPAFMYLLFDAQNNRQTSRKELAFNFGQGQGFANSALEVVLGGFPFTALGHQTQTRWCTVDGVPAVEAVWWAGGLCVTERIFPLADQGAFIRRIELASRNLGGPEPVSLRLSLPPGASEIEGGLLTHSTSDYLHGLGVVGPQVGKAVSERGILQISPLTVSPGQSLSVDTLIYTQIPANNAPSTNWFTANIEPSSPPATPRTWIEAPGNLRTEMNWARPVKPCDPLFQHIMVAYGGGSLQYRVRAPGQRPVTLVFGFCEGFHKQAGQRIMDLHIENQSRRTIDSVSEFGHNTPGTIAMEARDEDGDGWITLALTAANQAKDKNPLLNALWVFIDETPSPAKIIAGEANTSADAFLHTLSRDTMPPGIRLPSLDVGNAIEQARASWKNASALVTKDATIQDIFDKARYGLPGMIADNGVMDAGMFEYGAQWVRDTSNTLLGMIHAGHFELARQGFAYILEHMVNPEGNTMIGGAFDDPDREQFDQMGELIHALKTYRDWTGDDSLIREHRARLRAMIERPLRPEFRDSTGMVHNRREFWERTFEDAYELAYQTYVIIGLRDAADLAEPLGALDRANTWRNEADHIEQAMLSHPSRSLVESGRLIKRRSVTGERVHTIRFGAAAPDVPLKTEQVHFAEPDATMALPIAFRLIEPESPLARTTLDELEKLWNGRWFGGGYERYHSSGQCDQPGPWTFATCFILRAQHEARLLDRSRRTLEWLNTVQGGRTGAWFEEIPLVRSQAPTAGILPWTSGEISLFIVRHYLGVRFDNQHLVINPALYPNSPPVNADLRFRKGRLKLEIPGSGPFLYADANGQRFNTEKDGSIKLPTEFTGGSIRFYREASK